MNNLKKDRDLLRQALQDLENELSALRSSKKELEGKLRESSRQLDTVKSQEIKLRNLISLSMKKESTLLKKKNFAKDKLAEISKKMEKVRTIERELGDV